MYLLLLVLVAHGSGNTDEPITGGREIMIGSNSEPSTTYVLQWSDGEELTLHESEPPPTMPPLSPVKRTPTWLYIAGIAVVVVAVGGLFAPISKDEEK